MDTGSWVLGPEVLDTEVMDLVSWILGTGSYMLNCDVVLSVVYPGHINLKI